MSPWFLPTTPDVIGRLRAQAEVTRRGMVAFVAWSDGDAGAAQALRDAEHAADDDRRHLQAELRSAFSLPLDAEDLYELSERLDAVLNGAKDAVREAEVMAMAPDAPLAEMARCIAGGVDHLSAAFTGLPHDSRVATTEADAAIKTARQLERSYRAAMSSLLDTSDVRELLGRRELYRRYSRLGDAVVRVAERVWYTVVKEA